MAELIIHTNEVVINEGTLKKDVKKSVATPPVDNTKLLNEINHKLDLLLEKKEETDGETNH